MFCLLEETIFFKFERKYIIYAKQINGMNILIFRVLWNIDAAW